jgi:flagellar protein FliJ
MKAFKFRLQTLLRKRELDEKELLLQFLELKQVMQLEISKLIQLKKEMSEAFESIRNLNKGKIAVDMLIISENYLKKLEIDIKDQQKRVIEARVVVEAKNKEYIQASKKRKIVEKYKEHCIKKFNQELLHEEYEFQDEIAVLGHNIKTHELFGRHRIK